jgi:iron complex transport system substrate-binding protein
LRRSRVLAAVVLLIAATAVTLRIRSHLGQVETVRPGAGGAARLTDPVTHPWVAPEEAGAGPRRILSLAPSITEMVCALGLGDRLVGRTPYCRHPPQVAAVPVVGGLDASFEKIRSIAPDLILVTANSSQVIRGLEQLKMRYQAVPHDSLEEVYAAIVQIGDACGRPKTARALVGSIWADIDALQRAAREFETPPRRVLVVLGELPATPKALFVAGPGSFLEAFLELAGHTNAAREVLTVSHGEIPLEVLKRLDPDVILEFREPPTAGAPAGDPNRHPSRLGSPAADFGPLWQALRLKAIDNHQVRTVGGPEWLSAGPRAAIALQRFMVVLHGNQLSADD